jgi:hypothetical protein
MNKLQFILIFTSILIISACDPACDHLIEYKFEIPITLTPAKDSFSIGDTIWIETQFSDYMLDQNSNMMYKLEDFNFFREIDFVQMDISPFLDADTFFDIVIDKGEANLLMINNSLSLIEIIDSYQNNLYEFRLGFIPKEVGLFAFIVSSSPNLGFEGKIDLNSCVNERVEYIYNTNSGADNNFEYISLSADPWLKTTTKEIFDSSGQYCFYVVE